MIKLQGIEEHPRYNNGDNIIGKFNRFLTNPFYRYVIMLSILESSKYRDAKKIVEDAIEEATLMEEDAKLNELELASLRELLLSFVSSENYMNKYRGNLFEQIIRFSGPTNFKNYHPQHNSLEEVKIYCEATSYKNGECDKNVDVVFFDNGIRYDPNCYGVGSFVAFEIKCNINTFITGINKELKKGKELMAISNYTKLLYLKQMLLHFEGLSPVYLCTLKGISTYSKKFLQEHDFGCLEIWEAI